ncbi:MAG TPA: aminoglycoside phosphotransferase family protein [Oscillospiraceae bacterium]|nr:aminoglycoside phosphotransferase family protein [Oscillospiraceae bacterium]HPK35122.1 aminoglycoside phosphotransferase family protein [Oscillospiraceae bacterium]HPR74925.1 aminoglycoside phosphotransferase family protein [Oscillospiraceae bacterium]
MKMIQQILKDKYDISAVSTETVPVGWSAAAWKVKGEDGDYFLKIYDKQKPSKKCWVERIDRYMPAVLWLSQNNGLSGNMIAPLMTKNGAYKWEDDEFLYLVFPYVDGQTIGQEELSPEQVRELAKTVATLHRYGAEIPVSTQGLKENFDVSFCGELKEWLVKSGLLSQYAETIFNFAEELEKRAVTLRKADLKFVFCHTDIHGWNLMQADKLILIDWEGLKLAPPEADLFSFTNASFFGYAWEEFLKEYRTVHPDFQVNIEVMMFYQLRRRLEDIHAFAKSILFDGLSKEDKERSMWYLNRECEILADM